MSYSSQLYSGYEERMRAAENKAQGIEVLSDAEEAFLECSAISQTQYDCLKEMYEALEG